MSSDTIQVQRSNSAKSWKEKETKEKVSKGPQLEELGEVVHEEHEEKPMKGLSIGKEEGKDEKVAGSANSNGASLASATADSDAQTITATFAGKILICVLGTPLE